MRLIRTAFVLSTGFSLGAVYTLRHSTEIVDAIGDLRDEVIKAFSEQEDPEPLKKLLEYLEGRPDDEVFVTVNASEDSPVITAGDIRSLSVDYVPTLDALPEYTYPTKIILEKLGAYAKEHGIDDAGMIEFIENITNPNDETPKETTTT